MSSVQRFGRRRAVRLVGSQLRGVIIQSVKNLGHWHGTRRGIKIEMVTDSHGPHVRLVWRARIGKEWKQGNAESVYAAIAAIEELAGKANT